jgi:hypothetical protein
MESQNSQNKNESQNSQSKSNSQNFKKTHFSSSSPPEIFVGQSNYPKVFTGILSPVNFYNENDNSESNTEKFSMPEIWVKKNATIGEVMAYRRKMIYSRFVSDVKLAPRNSSSASNSSSSTQNHLTSALNQIAMANNSVRAEFFLKKAPKFSPIKESSVPFIGNPAPLQNIRLEENPKIDKKVDYLVSDTYLKANHGIKELYKSKIEISNIIKILSAGLLGLKKQRKMVPTRWSITAIDDSLSKDMLKSIKLFPEISEFQVFHSEYVGNHYEILLLPDKFSFEVIETRIPTKNPVKLSQAIPNIEFWQDWEGFFPRKNYASSVTGAYYANRLALCEYLTQMHRQASAIFFREVRPEYNAPLGVGILREVTRKAFQSPPQKFSTLSEALQDIQTRIFLPVSTFTNRSNILKQRGKQKRLSQFF